MILVFWRKSYWWSITWKKVNWINLIHKNSKVSNYSFHIWQHCRATSIKQREQAYILAKKPNLICLMASHKLTSSHDRPKLFVVIFLSLKIMLQQQQQEVISLNYLELTVIRSSCYIKDPNTNNVKFKLIMLNIFYIYL